MSSKSNIWLFKAETPEQLVTVLESIPPCPSEKIAGELFQMGHLLKALAGTEYLDFPCAARHIGDDGIPDLELLCGKRKIALEMAKVTTTNLEHARKLQAKIPEPPSHFEIHNLCNPEPFALKLKTKRAGWYKFVADRLPAECRTWLTSWNGTDKVPNDIKVHFVATLNSIIDGPPIKDEPALARAFPQPILISVEGFPSDERPRHRKDWLNDAFWEEFTSPINPTLMVSPFIRQHDTRMKRDEVFEAGFLIPAMPAPGPTLEQEREIWIEKVMSEVDDKSGKLKDPAFQHGDEDWLVLWDRLGAPEWSIQDRARELANRLAPLWQPNWFRRIFIQAEYFEWLLVLSSEETSIIRAEGE